MNMGMQIQNDIGKITTIVNFLFHPSHIYLDLLLLEPGTSLGVISSQEFRYVHIPYTVQTLRCIIHYQPLTACHISYIIYHI